MATVPTRTYPCRFRHWTWQVPEPAMRFSSPHFSKTDAGKGVLAAARDPAAGAVMSVDATFLLPGLAIQAGNEGFAEAAVADPLADLAVWFDWHSGKRTFPYPGTYAPFGLTAQQAKQAATSVVGVCGEIITGLFAQAGLAFTPLIRPIHHWPDFIFVTSGGRVEYVEAKGHSVTSAVPVGAGVGATVPETVFRDCLLQALPLIDIGPARLFLERGVFGALFGGPQEGIAQRVQLTLNEIGGRVTELGQGLRQEGVGFALPNGVLMAAQGTFE